MLKWKAFREHDFRKVIDNFISLDTYWTNEKSNGLMERLVGPFSNLPLFSGNNS